jgi:hypothetical protein
MAAATRHRYGPHRMAKPLQDAGFHVGRAKARRLMHKVGVAVQRPKRRGPMTTDSRHVWAGDITDIGTAAGWLYLSRLVD